MSTEELTRYADSMEQVKGRLTAAQEWLLSPPTYPNVEAAALQARLALEVLMLSSLIPNRAAIEKVASAFAKKDHEEARRLVRRVNPNYWPEPGVRVEEAPRRFRLDPVSKPRLGVDEYPATWGKLSAWLHARNPYQTALDPVEGSEQIREAIERLRDLLHPQHARRLRGGDHLIICVMNVPPHGRAQAWGFERTS